MRFKKSWGLGAVGAAVMVVSPAVAQESDIAQQDVDIYEYDDTTSRSGPLREFGVAVTGGLNTYTNDLADATGVGGFLGLQANSRPLPLMGVELGYEGSRNPFENIDGGLWRHNVSALAKVGPELGRNGGLRPFVGAGFGVSSLNPSEDAEFIYDTDFVTEVPVAAGLDYKIGAVTAGARATYRFMGGESLGRDVDGDVMNFGLNVGGNF